jgi:hypothetical protein
LRQAKGRADCEESDMIEVVVVVEERKRVGYTNVAGWTSPRESLAKR